MKNMTKIHALLMMTLLALSSVASAATISYSVQGSFNDDYDMWVGSGNISSPDFIQQVATKGNNNFSETTGTLDVLDSLVWNTTWWLHADDNWSFDDGSIMLFSILVDGITYTSPDTPVFIPDNSDRYAYLSMSGAPSAVPVPAAVWLMGSGLLGLMGFSRKAKKLAA